MIYCFEIVCSSAVEISLANLSAFWSNEIAFDSSLFVVMKIDTSEYRTRTSIDIDFIRSTYLTRVQHSERFFLIAQIICDFEAYITLIERCHFHLGQNGNAFECGKMKINTRQNSTIWVMVWLTEWNSWPPFPNLALECSLTTFSAAFINISHFDRLLSTWLRILLINSLYLPCYCYSLMWSERHFWVVTSF